MRFVFRMAWREVRAGWARLLFFFLCVAVGVAAIVSLRSIVQNVRLTLTSEARTLIGADLVIQSPRAWSDDVRGRIDSLLSSEPTIARTEVVQTTTMARAAKGDGVRLIEVRGVETAYPFYGTLTLQSGHAYSHTLLESHGAIVQPELLAQLGIDVGDSILISGEPFVVRDVLIKERVQRSAFALGPRVYVDLADLEHTSLLSFGARATRQLLVKVDARSVDALTANVRKAFERDVLSVQSFHTLGDRAGQSLTIGENYLSLVGFAVVVLGGIGIWSVTRVFVQQKVKSVAILKCVGGTSRQVLAIYSLQVALLAAAGSALGVGIAWIALAAIPQSLLDTIGVATAEVTLSAAAQGLAVGILVSLLFSVVPLLEMRHVKPLVLMRADSAFTARRRDWRSVLTGTAIIMAIVLVAVWQAGSLRAGLYVSAGFGVVAAVLHLASRLLVRVVLPISRSRRFELRHAIVSLGRPGNQTRVVLMAVGLGCFFILSVRAVQVSLLAEFSPESRRNAPDLVLIDIQPDQLDGVRTLASARAGVMGRWLPLMHSRVVAVHGDRVVLPTAEDVRKDGDFSRDFGLTFRNVLQDNERIVAGTFWSTPLPDTGTTDGMESEVSIEEHLHDEQHLDLGDVLSFDIAGRVIRARVTSIRKVTWDDAQNGGFVFVMRPGPIEKAPHTFVGFVSGLPDAGDRAAFERDLVQRFANVSAIDVREVLRSIEEVTKNISLAVTVVGAITLLGGVLILVGAVAMTKFQRLYDTAIYRTLGAGTRAIVTMVAIEYGVLGTLAGVLGAIGAAVLSWAVSTHLFEIDWQPAMGMLAAGVALTALLVCFVGVIASLDVLLRKPLATLRGE